MTNRIGRTTASGDVREFTIPDAAALGRAIGPGPDGRIWVAGSGLDGRVHVWAVDASGLSDEIAPLGDNPSFGTGFLPAAIVSGPDGNAWISKLSSIARVSPGGRVTEFPIGGEAIPTSITAGPDAHLWFLATRVPRSVGIRQALTSLDDPGVRRLSRWLWRDAAGGLGRLVAKSLFQSGLLTVLRAKRRGAEVDGRGPPGAAPPRAPRPALTA